MWYNIFRNLKLNAFSSYLSQNGMTKPTLQIPGISAYLGVIQSAYRPEFSRGPSRHFTVPST